MPSRVRNLTQVKTPYCSNCNTEFSTKQYRCTNCKRPQSILLQIPSYFTSFSFTLIAIMFLFPVNDYPIFLKSGLILTVGALASIPQVRYLIEQKWNVKINRISFILFLSLIVVSSFVFIPV